MGFEGSQRALDETFECCGKSHGTLCSSYVGSLPRVLYRTTANETFVLSLYITKRESRPFGGRRPLWSAPAVSSTRPARAAALFRPRKEKRDALPRVCARPCAQNTTPDASVRLRWYHRPLSELGLSLNVRPSKNRIPRRSQSAVCVFHSDLESLVFFPVSHVETRDGVVESHFDLCFSQLSSKIALCSRLVSRDSSKPNGLPERSRGGL